MSETETISQEEALRKLAVATADYVPEALWTVGGAFRYDRSLTAMANFFATSLGVRRIDTVAGVPPCLWNLDYFVQRRPVPLDLYCNMLETYAQLGIGVTLVFDNPCLTTEQLQDTYGALLVQQLYERDRIRKNSVCVASDALAAKIREMYPKMKVSCHYNRLIAETQRRSAALYNRLAEQYTRVTLHPADAGKPSLWKDIEHPERFDIVLNDPTPRNHPLRRELLQLLAAMRVSPYDAELMRRRAELHNKVGETRHLAETLQRKDTCNLSRAETQALYDAGFRSFIIQQQHFRNEMTLLWDLFQCMLSYSPELINKHALIASSAMAEFGRAKETLPSGLRQFAFSQSE